MKSRVSDICDPLFDGNGVGYLKKTYRKEECPELNDKIRNSWVAVCSAQRAYEDISLWNEQLAQETTFVGRLTGELEEAVQTALVRTKKGCEGQETCPRVSSCFTTLQATLEKGLESDCGMGHCEFVESAVNSMAKFNCSVMSPNVGMVGGVERRRRSSWLLRLAWLWCLWFMWLFRGGMTSRLPPSSTFPSE